MPTVFARPGKILFLELGDGENGYDTRDYPSCEMNIGISDDGKPVSKDRALAREIDVTVNDFPVVRSNRIGWGIANGAGTICRAHIYKHHRSAVRKAKQVGKWVEPVIL